MGAGDSYACAVTGTPAPAIGDVGAEGGTCGSVCAGGTAPVPGSGVPACSPLSKLCINSPGVAGWGGPPANGPPAMPAGLGALPMPDGEPNDGAPGIPPPPPPP
ncbi:MAG TPA: hypothetical protein VGC05_16805 [Mycobacterium sp.]